ncbi:biosynthetic arginine decarboxylase [Kaarinaea lacus]
MKDWNIKDSLNLYNIPHWSGGYIDINDAGHLVVNSRNETSTTSVDLYQLTESLKSSDLSLPCLVRFPHILHDRTRLLKKAFADAMSATGYKGLYKPVFPIKVNQEQSVVTELLDSPDPIGLEAGSKPELMAVLALSETSKSVIVCNGYKDREYIRLALIATAIGHRIYIVLEKPSEIEILISEARSMNIKPHLGIRVRLDSINNSKWQNTGGEKSKFGFSSSQILAALKSLDANGLLPNLELLHFHLGSQITNIDDIKKGVTECARYYSELHKAGAVNLDTVDVGGGLGIDYEGTRSRNYFSMNYSVSEYASTIVSTLENNITAAGLKHPHIVTESGRAMVAHHAVLIVEVIETEHVAHDGDSINTNEQCELSNKLKGLLTTLENDSAHPVEAYHNANGLMQQVKQSFNLGTLGLQEKATCEELYLQACELITKKLSHDNKSQRETLDALNEKLASKYYCNFSLFQSLPDVWAIDQIFPIVPLGRLNEKPDTRGTLHDITCDSDGRIDLYVDGDGIESSLPLHPVTADAPYYLGIFLVGAYQEILGDMHNLFGDTNAVNVEFKDGSFELSKLHHGDTVEFVLRHVHYDTEKFIDTYKTKLDNAGLSQQLYQEYLSELESGITGYTYLED